MKLPSIQFARFLAAAVVAFFHANNSLMPFIPEGVTRTGWNYVNSVGAAGVHIFFVISGFVMVYASFSGATPSSSGFAAGRFIRIVPIYWIYATFYLMAFTLIGASRYSDLPSMSVVASYLLVPPYSSSIIVPGWTLSFEIYFYIWFAAILALGATRGLCILTLVFLISIAGGAALHVTSPVARLASNPLLLEFLAGAWLGYVVIRGLRVPRSMANALLICGFAGFVLTTAIGYTKMPLVVAWGTPSALLVAGFVFRDMNGQSGIVVKRLSYLGDSSYSLYLLNTMALAAMASFLPQPEVPERILLSLVLTSVCVAAALGPYLLVERPLTRLLRSINRPVDVAISRP